MSFYERLWVTVDTFATNIRKKWNDCRAVIPEEHVQNPTEFTVRRGSSDRLDQGGTVAVSDNCAVP